MSDIVARILSSAKSTSLTIPPSKPYSWSGGGHDIAFTRGNIPLIGMSYVFEGDDVPEVMIGVFEAAKSAAEADGADADTIKVYEDMKIQLVISETYEQMSNWFIILVACHQVRDLSQSNIDNFAKMCKTQTMPAKALLFISYWAANVPSLASNGEVRKKFESNKFFEYHTTGSSTPSLCVQAMEEVATLGLFTKEEARVVQSALDAIHDLEAARMIADLTLVKVRAILEAAGTLPEVWYMGQKAVDKFSGKKYVAIVKIIKQIFKIQTDLEDIDTMTLPTLVTRFTDLMIDQDMVLVPVPTPE